MKILQIDTYDISGGAARAAYRLHRGLLQIGQDCRTLVRYKASTDDSVFCLIPENPAEKVDEEFFLSVAIQQHYIDSHRTDISNTLFSLPYPGYDLSTLPVVQAADIINLHWVAQYQSPLTLHKLFALGKPVVWTLHDQWAFTGGCHYSAGCEEYCHGCAPCPQLADDPFELPGAVLKDKLRFFKDANLTIVTPSRWMAECARQSRLFKDLRVEVIPNSLETDVFSPQPKSEAKESIGISAETITLLFGGEDSNERRKGFRELKAAVQYCLKDARFQNLVKSDKIRMICFGRLSDDLNTVGIPVIPLGYLDSDEKISAAYSSADIFILPSLEDNLPNTMLEAMSCGTPVVAFDVGGMPDVIVNGVTGKLAPVGDVQEMGSALLCLIFDPDQREAMGQACRKAMVNQYSLEIQARRYFDLFKELRNNCAVEALANTSGDQANSIMTPVQDTGVCLESGLGPHFQAISDRILLKALKELTPVLQKRLDASEADREARLKAIHSYEKQLQEVQQHLQTSDADREARLKAIHSYEKQLQEVQQHLQTSDADREARLKAIHSYEKQLQEVQQHLQTSDADREARLEAIHLYEKQLQEVQQHLQATEADREARLNAIHSYEKQLQELQQHLQASEADREARLNAIHSYEKQLQEVQQQMQTSEAAHQETVNYLSSPSKALRIVIKRIVYRSIFVPFFDRYYNFFDHIYLWLLQPIRLFKRDRSKAGVDSTPSIDSPLVEAFITARSLEGDLDDEALEFFYEMGRNLHYVLCIHPSARNNQALYMLSKAGSKVSCVVCEQRIADELASFGITPIKEDLAKWMANSGQIPLADYDALVFDSGIEEHNLFLLRGHLWPKNRIFITGFGSDSNSSIALLGEAGRTAYGIAILDTPPSDWLDPAHKDRSFYLQTDWPWKPRSVDLPPTLPSGRPWPKISVVTVTLNQEAYLEETLRSVLLQGYPNLEYIVVDGGSTDRTLAILERYRSELAYCKSEKDKGQADALNKGFRLATGDILAWLNSDDRYLPGTLLRVALAFDIYDADIVAGGCALVQGDDKVPFRTHHNAMPLGQVIPLPLDRLLDIDGSWQKGDFFYQPEVFWLRDIWLQSGARVDEKLFYSMDYELWVRMARQGARIVHIPDTLSLFRMHENQKTSGIELPFLPELRQVSAGFHKGSR